MKAIDDHRVGELCRKSKNPGKGEMLWYTRTWAPFAGRLVRTLSRRSGGANRPGPGSEGRAKKGDDQVVAGLAEHPLDHQGKLPVRETVSPGHRVAAKGNDMLVVNGEAGQPHLLDGRATR